MVGTLTDEFSRLLAATSSISAQITVKRALEKAQEELQKLIGGKVKVYLVQRKSLVDLGGVQHQLGGIAGEVASSVESLSLEDATRRKSFASAIDGEDTGPLLCRRSVDGGSKVVATVSVSRAKGEEPFTSLDEKIVSVVADQLGVTLPNCEMFEDANQLAAKTEPLIDFVKSMSSNDMPFESLVRTIRMGVKRVVDADICTLFLIDRPKGQLWSLSSAMNEIIRIPMTSGLAGDASGGNVVNVPDAYNDSRFNRSVDQKTGYRTKSVLCMPVYDQAKVVVGVLQLVNKLSPNETDGVGVFTKEDERILESFCVTTGLHLHNSSLRFEGPSSVEVFPDKLVQRRSTSGSTHIPTSITEDDEEEG